MKKTIPIGEGVADLFGTYDGNIKYLESLLDVEVHIAPDSLTVEGNDNHVSLVEQLIEDYAQFRAEGVKLSGDDLKSIIRIVAEDNSITMRQVVTAPRQFQVGKRNVSPKSLNQKLYMEAIDKYDMVFGIGPAGTGKTYLAVSMAVRELLGKRVSRIVLTPAGCRGRRAAGVLARNGRGKGRSLPKTHVRRTLRIARRRQGGPLSGETGYRDRTDRLHARADPERCLRHPGRSAEHHSGTNEDVPDAASASIRRRSSTVM